MSSDTDERCLAVTPILDHDHPVIRRLAASLVADAGELDLLREAHREIGRRVTPVYSVDEHQPASRTLIRARGSCSQRFAVLEAVARARGIATRVRGLEVRGSFWYPRFRFVRPLIPKRVVLAWPSFLVDGRWLEIGELFAGTTKQDGAFTNDGETLFEAVRTVAIDWDGTRPAPSCDLSGAVGRDLGLFDTRDELFRLHRTSRRRLLAMAEPVLRRWAPRSAR